MLLPYTPLSFRIKATLPNLVSPADVVNMTSVTLSRPLKKRTLNNMWIILQFKRVKGHFFKDKKQFLLFYMVYLLSCRGPKIDFFFMAMSIHLCVRGDDIPLHHA